MVLVLAICRNVCGVGSKRCHLSTVLCSILPPFILGKKTAHDSLLPVQADVNEVQNLPGKHQEELLPACFAGRSEGSVCTSHKGKKLGAPVSPFPRCEEEGSGSRPVFFFFFCPRCLLHRIYSSKYFFPVFFLLKLVYNIPQQPEAKLTTEPPS